MSAARTPLCLRRCPWFCLVLVAVLLPAPAPAQIVNSATGEIDLKLSAFFGGNPSQTLTAPVSLADTSASINGKGFYSVGGLSQVDFNHLASGPAQTWLTTYANAESDNEPEGGGGYAKLDLSFYAQAPFYYRFEADVIGNYAVGYEVTFNGNSANAYVDGASGLYKGTFPFIYIVPGDPTSGRIGWDTYVDEGFLPAGLYDLSVEASSTLMHGFGVSTTGTSSLLIQMQGDTNLDGFIGIEDLNTVLSNWNDHVPTGAVQFGDLSRDGYVGVEDLNQVLSNWNSSVAPPSIAVPEPATGVFAVTIGLALAGRRQRV
jgi:hypothetical protein